MQFFPRKICFQVMEQCLLNGAMKGTSKGDNGEAGAVYSSKRMATLRAASQVGLLYAVRSMLKQ